MALRVLAEDRLLAGDQAQVALDVGDLVLVGLGVDARVQADLHELRDLVLVLVAAELHQLRVHVLDVVLLECGCVCSCYAAFLRLLGS